MSRPTTPESEALRRLVSAGTKLRPFSKAIMEACEKAAFELYKELEVKSPHWKRIFQAGRSSATTFPLVPCREGTYDNYVFSSKVGAEPSLPKAAKK